MWSVGFYPSLFSTDKKKKKCFLGGKGGGGGGGFSVCLFCLFICLFDKRRGRGVGGREDRLDLLLLLLLLLLRVSII